MDDVLMLEKIEKKQQEITFQIKTLKGTLKVSYLSAKYSISRKFVLIDLTKKENIS